MRKEHYELSQIVKANNIDEFASIASIETVVVKVDTVADDPEPHIVVESENMVAVTSPLPPLLMSEDVELNGEKFVVRTRFVDFEAMSGDDLIDAYDTYVNNGELNFRSTSAAVPGAFTSITHSPLS